MFIHLRDMEASGDLGESSSREAVRIQIEIKIGEEKKWEERERQSIETCSLSLPVKGWGEKAQWRGTCNEDRV